ncbi:DUF6350 family protein [Streptomyces pathocidini]|uniref:cell division protein PerM n=1 Tax=Streptomyces pathocidini TaxID=1650571 RepID=UPI0033FFC2A6
MTQSTDRRPPLPSLLVTAPPPSSRSRRGGQRGQGHPFAGGLVAAALGLGGVTVAVLLLWISSPYPAGGPGGALHAAASLWLLAHGADLVRADTVSGGGAPLGVTPLLLSALPLWLLYRATRHALESREEELAAAGRESAGEPCALTTIGWLSAGYLLVGTAVTVYAAGGPLRVDVLSAVLHLPVVTVAAVAYAFWVAVGRPREPLEAAAGWAIGRVPEGAWQARLERCRAVLTPRRLATAVRAAAAGAAVLLGGGALLVAASLVWHWGAAGAAFAQLSQVWSGRFSVLLLGVALVPNAAVWGAAYALGPGFALGAGTVTPLASPPHPGLPDFPLLAAVPDAGPGTPLTWAVAALPVAAGTAVGWYVARAAVPGAAVAWAAVPGAAPGHVARASGGTVRGAVPGAAVARVVVPGAACGADHASGAAGGQRPHAVAGTAEQRAAVARAAVPGPGSEPEPDARTAARAAGGVRGWRDTALVAGLGSAGYGVVVAVLAELAGGALGGGAMEDFGPRWWFAGAAALGWAGTVGVPVALLVRWWRARRGAAAVSARGEAETRRRSRMRLPFRCG